MGRDCDGRGNDGNHPGQCPILPHNKVLNGYGNFSIKTWWKIADALFMDLRKLIGRHEDDI